MARLVSPLGFLLVLIIQLNLLVSPCAGQVTQVFQWTFTASNQQISSSITQCQTYPITVSPMNTSTTAVGTGPYYVLAFPSGGFASTSLVGTDPKNLSWQVKYPAGTQLLLGMTDSTGIQAGGMASQLLTVTAGDTSCMPPAATTNLAVIGNVTKDLSTCKPWGLKVSGGTPPYNITLAAVGSPVVTNVTLPSGDDVLTWIDRAPPNTQILAAVSDANGQWGNGTAVVNTIGSSDDSCVGLISKAGNSSQVPFFYTAPSNTKQRTIGIAVGVTLGGIAVIAGTVLFVLCMRRKSRRERGIEDGQDTLPRVFGTLSGTDYTTTSFGSPTSHSGASTLADKQLMSQLVFAHVGSSSSAPNSTLAASPPGIDPSTEFRPRSGHSHASSTDRPLPAIPPHSPNSPRPDSRDSGSSANYYPVGSSAARRHAKAAEAQSRPGTADDVYPPNGSQAERRSAASNHRPISRPNRPFSGDGNVEPDIIIQHRDGGVVQELPPPYLDRSMSGTATTSQ